MAPKCGVLRSLSSLGNLPMVDNTGGIRSRGNAGMGRDGARKPAGLPIGLCGTGECLPAIGRENLCVLWLHRNVEVGHLDGHEENSAPET